MTAGGRLVCVDFPLAVREVLMIPADAFARRELRLSRPGRVRLGFFHEHGIPPTGHQQPYVVRPTGTVVMDSEYGPLELWLAE